MAANAGAQKTKKTKSKASPKRAAEKTERVKRFDGRSTKQPAAIAFLMQQHRDVEALFKRYEKAEGDKQKAKLSARICQALKVHTQIEEELLYPDAHAKLNEDMVDEAYVEHDSAKSLIAQIEAMKVGDHLYDAKVKVLGEYIKHHVCEEETELFPAIVKSDIDLDAVAPRLERRSGELMRDLSGAPDPGPGRSRSQAADARA